MRVFSSLSECMVAEIPVLVPSFNNPTYLRNMLKQLAGMGACNTIVIDNGSTAPGMDAAFALARNVVLLAQNHGPRYSIFESREFESLPNLFCLTDPDLQFNVELPRSFLSDLADLTECFEIGKIGFSLDIADWANMRTDDVKHGDSTCKIWEWEGQFWTDQIGSSLFGDPIYRALVDTTFALYNKRYFQREKSLNALRIAGRYTAKHLPWYWNQGVPEDEARYYASTQKFSHYQSKVL